MELPTPEDLKNRREAAGLTQSELAKRADVSQPLIARIEGGDVDPRLSTLRRIVGVIDADGEGGLRARDLMHEGVVHVAPDDSVREAERTMEEEAFSQLPVLRAGSPVGSISHTEVLRAGEAETGDDEGVGDLPVSEVMAESFPEVSPDADLDRVRGLLEHRKAVVVTEGGETVGIITQADVARALS